MYWVIAALVVLFGVALLARAGVIRPPAGRTEPVWPGVEPLKPGESYDASVKLATVPNVPLADLWCQRLEDEGIEAFYKSGPASPNFVGAYGGPDTNPSFPVEIWVGEHDVERARELFPELT